MHKNVYIYLRLAIKSKNRLVGILVLLDDTNYSSSAYRIIDVCCKYLKKIKSQKFFSVISIFNFNFI